MKQVISASVYALLAESSSDPSRHIVRQRRYSDTITSYHFIDCIVVCRLCYCYDSSYQSFTTFLFSFYFIRILINLLLLLYLTYNPILLFFYFVVCLCIDHSLYLWKQINLPYSKNQINFLPYVLTYVLFAVIQILLSLWATVHAYLRIHRAVRWEVLQRVCECVCVCV